MLPPDYLFPHRLTRRDFLRTAATTAAGLAVASQTQAHQPTAPVRVGEGRQTYTLDETWGTLPAGMKYGYGCALVVDSKDRIFVTSRSASPCVAIFDRAGQLLETWSNQFTEKVSFSPQQYAATAHGLYWSKEADGEYLYWTENVSTPRNQPKIGARVYKTDMQGKVLYTL